MSHRRRRVSRLLLAVLGLVIGAGVFTYARRGDGDKASSGGDAKATAAAPAPQTTQPSAHAAASAATTAPVAKDGGTSDALATLVTETPAIPDGTAAAAATGPGGQSSAPASPASDAVPLVAVPASSSAASPQVSTPTQKQPAAAKDVVVAAAPSAAPQKVEVRPYDASAGGRFNSSTGTSSGGAAVERGRSLVQAGKLLEARDAVNGALASGHLNGQEQASARQLLAEINRTVVFSPRRFAEDKWGGTYSVQSGDRLDRIGAKYGLTPALLMRLNNISDARRLRAGATIKVLRGPFHAVVSKSNFRLDLYLGAPGGPDSVYVTSFNVGLGKDDSTPKGRWLVEPQKKIENPVYFSPRGEGIIEANDPKNPLGEYWIGLVGTDGDAVGKQSYGIHGTIDPDSIGKQESMGCVRLRNEDVAVVFEALTEGKSTVVITD